MNVLEEYKRKLRTPEQAVQVIKSGDWIDYTTSRTADFARPRAGCPPR